MGSPDGHQVSWPAFCMGRFPLQPATDLHWPACKCSIHMLLVQPGPELECPPSQSCTQPPHALCAGVASPSALDRTRSAAGRPGSAELNHMAQIYGLACPITKTLMMDPVVASDGYTVRSLAASCKTYMGAIWAVMDPVSEPAVGPCCEQDMLVPLDSRDMVWYVE